MASLTLVIDTLDATVTADDIKARNIVNGYADSISATGTNQQRAKAVLNALVQYMVRESRRHRVNAATSEAMTAVQVELDGLTWE